VSVYASIWWFSDPMFPYKGNQALAFVSPWLGPVADVSWISGNLTWGTNG
jgi:hypothetical protein